MRPSRNFLDLPGLEVKGEPQIKHKNEADC